MISTFTVGEAFGALAKFSHYPKILVEGPRGTSKSRSILGYFLAKLFEFPGSRLLLCRRYRTDLTKTILTTLEEEVFPAFGIPIPGGAHRSGRSEYRLPNGSTIWPAGIDDGMGVLSMGITYAYAAEVIEMEEEMVTDIAGGLRWLRSPEHPTLPEHSQLIMDTNPGPPSHWANRRAEPIDNHLRFVRTVEDYLALQQHNYRPAVDPVNRWKRIVTKHQDNPGYWDHDTWDYTPLGRTYVTQQLEGLTGYKRSRWLDGLWKSAEGAVFPEFNEEMHVIRPFRIPGTIGPDGKLPSPDERAWPIYVFIDPGYDHPTGIFWLTIAPNGRHYIIDEIKEGGRSVAQHAQRIHERNRGRTIRQYFGDPHGAFSRAPSGAESVAEQFRKYSDIALARWPPSTNQKPAMVNKVREMLLNKKKDGRPGLVVFSTCHETINEFQAWRYKRDINGQPRQGDDQFEDANNDLLDGICGAAAMNLTPDTRQIQIVRPEDERPRSQDRPWIVNSFTGKPPKKEHPLAGMRMFRVRP